MLVECIGNRVSDLPKTDRTLVRQSVHLKEVGLVPGQRYVVYGVVLANGLPWYLIAEEENDEYPKPQFAGFFKVIDETIPSGWRFQWREGYWPDGKLLPSEWCQPGFFEALVDGGSREVAIFKAKKAEIDAVSQLLH